jgi:hypothetical protein
MNTPNPVPPYFNTRYVLWFVFWKNAVTTLSILQAMVAALLLLADGDSSHTIVTPTAFRFVVLANAALTAIVAQIDRRKTPDSLKLPEKP